MMMGCQQSTHLSPTIPANLLQPCADLKLLESGQGKDILLWSIGTVAQYNDCKDRHSAILEAINS